MTNKPRYKIVKEGPKGREWQIFDIVEAWTVNEGYATREDAERDLLLLIALDRERRIDEGDYTAEV